MGSFCFIQSFLCFCVDFSNCFSCLCGFLCFSWMELRNFFLCCLNYFSFLRFDSIIDNLINNRSMLFFLKFIGNVSLMSWFYVGCVIISFCNCSQDWWVWILNCKSSWFIRTRNSNRGVRFIFWYMEMVDMFCLSWVKMMVMFVHFFNNSEWR